MIIEEVEFDASLLEGLHQLKRQSEIRRSDRKPRHTGATAEEVQGSLRILVTFGMISSGRVGWDFLRSHQERLTLMSHCVQPV